MAFTNVLKRRRRRNAANGGSGVFWQACEMRVLLLKIVANPTPAPLLVLEALLVATAMSASPISSSPAHPRLDEAVVPRHRPPTSSAAGMASGENPDPICAPFSWR